MKVINKKIYLFELKANKNDLKEFIYFLKFKGSTGVIDFTYSGGLHSFHKDTTLKDNFIIDSVPKSLIKNKDDNFRARIKKLKNKSINNLISYLEPIERPIFKFSDEELLLASIVKSLLSESQYIFLSFPEMGLSHNIVEQIKKSIDFEATHNNRSIFINSKHTLKWLELSTIFVKKDSDGSFLETKKEKRKELYIMKQAS